MATVHARAGAVLLTAPNRNELYLKVARGLAERGTPMTMRMPIGEGISGRVAATGEPLRGRVGNGPDELALGPSEPPAVSVIAVPMKSANRVVGVIDLYDPAEDREYDDDALGTIRTFATQATVAIDNVLLHQEAQRLSITDGLTGLWNYRYFTMNFGKEIERAARFGRPLALLDRKRVV